MILCIIINTVGRSVPIYFVNPKVADFFGSVVLYLTLISVAITIYRKCYKREKHNWVFAGAISVIVTFLIYIIIGFITFFDGFSSFTDVEVLYVKRDNPDIRIIRQYVDSGALGDGYTVVIRTNITSFLKYEEFIDTNTIDKKEWTKQKSYNP